MSSRFSVFTVLLLTIAGSACATELTGTSHAERQPLIIAHRGASGYVPEHTLEAYTLAIQQGADYIEPDLVMTKDGHLIARHDNVLDLTTDVSTRPEFSHRKTTKFIDGISVTGWFSEDFTLREIKTLRAIERIPQARPGNARLNGQFKVPTLQEVIDLVKNMKRVVGRDVGLYPETKHPTYFDSLGLSMEEPLVWTLHRNGYNGPRDKVFIQSFEISNLRDLNRMTRLPLVQLLWLDGKPYDVEASGGTLTYDQMATPEGLREIARYADGVGPEKNHFILPLNAQGELDISNATDFVRNAHAVGLKVHPYTFRAENAFLPANLRNGVDPTARGQVEQEIRLFLQTGIDGLFTDQVDAGIKARN